MTEFPGVSTRPVRVLHNVGHLLRGGIEMWLFQTLLAQSRHRFEHTILVRTEEEESFTSAFRDAGIPVLACSRFNNPVRYASDFRKLVREHGPYDILHVHGSSFSGLLTLFLAKPSGIPRTIVHSHNDVRPHLNDRGRLYRAYVTGVLRLYRTLADCGFAASILAAESMFGVQWKKDKRWELLYYGVDCRPFDRPKDNSLRSKLGIPESAFVIGHVGRFHEQKNHEFLIDVVGAAVARRPETHCLLIGDGPLRPAITEEIRRRRLETHFTFVPDTTTVSLYMTSAMDCFVFPSRYEGLGLVAVEAQAAGLPCLISNRVPSEAVVDPSLVTVLPLERSADAWAETALGLKQPQTESAGNTVAKVKNSRFNLENCAAYLQGRYLQLAQRQSL